jgi:multimeric flavodoxin WrbA
MARKTGTGPPIIDQLAGLHSNAAMFNGDESAGRVTIVMGSARADGNTASAVQHLRRLLGSGARLADLSAITICPFDYARSDDRDDFQSVVRTILAGEHIIFATPVYWYSMSGVMKIFFDRLTDLLIDPDNRRIGCALAGRNVWLLATGTDDCLPSGFHEPFAKTAAYFGMVWRGAFYCRSFNGAPFSAGSHAEVEKLVNMLVG